MVSDRAHGDEARNVRALLAGHQPVDEREAASIARTLGELDRLDAPYDEHGDPTHVTASAIVVGQRGVLLLVHRRLGFWLQPGGHIDAGEEPAEAAVREAREETGIDVAHPPGGPRFVHVDVHEGAQGHVHLDLRFLLVAPADDEPCPPAGESQQVEWFSWDDADAIADEGLRGALVTARPLPRSVH